MKEQSTRQNAAMRARMRHMRVQYRRRMIVVGVLLFIIGAVLGVFAARWYAGATPNETALPDTAVTMPPEEPTPAPEATEAPAEEPEEEAAPEASGDEADAFGWEMFDGDDGEVDAVIFPEDDDAEAAEGAEAVASSENVAFPEVEAPVEEAPAEETPVEETPVEAAPAEETPVEETPVEETPAEEAPVEEAPVEETPVEEAVEAPAEAEPTPVPNLSSDEVAEYDPTQAEVPEEYLNLEDENGQAEAETAGDTVPAGEAAPASLPWSLYWVEYLLAKSVGRMKDFIVWVKLTVS